MDLAETRVERLPDMAEVIAQPVTLAAQTLVESLREVQLREKDNSTIAQEIGDFIASLNENIEQLGKIPKSSSLALESLVSDLNDATITLNDGLGDGFDPQKSWDSKETRDKLETLRNDLMKKLAVKVFISKLEMTITAEGKLENFELRMLELSTLSATQSQVATAVQVRKLLQPLVMGKRRKDLLIQSFVSMVRGQESQFVQFQTSTDTQNVFSAVLANLEEDLTRWSVQPMLPPEEFQDPITKQLMDDPVKCSDGRTYDRFSVFQNNLSTPRPSNNKVLVIVSDNFDVRTRLLEYMAEEGLQGKVYNLRKSYRDEALEMAAHGNKRKARAMLKNVLQWDPYDMVCQEMQDYLKRKIVMRRRGFFAIVLIPLPFVLFIVYLFVGK